MSKRSSILAVMLGFTLVGCGDGEQREKMNVLRGAAPEAPLSAEMQRKRAMQAILIKRKSTDEMMDVGTDWLSTSLFHTCLQVRYGDNTTSPPSAAFDERTPCPERITATYLCTVAALMDIAKGNSAEIPYLWDSLEAPPSDTGGPFLLPPQSAASRVAVAGYALSWLRLAIQAIAGDLRNGICNSEYQDTRTEAASMLAEAYFKGEELYEMGIDAELAVADNDWASSSDMLLRVSRSMNAPELSRAAAVSWLVGGGAPNGSDGLLSFPVASNGFCVQSPLSPKAEAALRILRQAAQPPLAIQAIPANAILPQSTEIPIDDLLNLRGLTFGSVVERLEHSWNIPIGEDIQTRFGLDTQAFVEARAYLSQEISAFSRSPTVSRNPSDPVTFREYTATAVPPVPRPNAYYAAIARSSPLRFNNTYIESSLSWYNDKVFDWSTCNDAPPFNFSGWDHALDRFRGNMLKRISCLESGLEAGSIAVLAAVRNRLQGVQRETILHGYACDTPDSSCTSQYINLDGAYLPDRGYRVVRGEEAMDCMTKGNVDGINCTESGIGGIWKVCDMINVFGVRCGFGILSEPNATWYLLRTKGPGTWVSSDENTEGHWSDEPGNWELVTGFKPQDPPPYSETVNPWPQRTIHVYSDIEERIGKILQPDRKWCSKPQHNCLGLSGDDPLPLQNELSGESSDRESSWKYYLQLAKDAAAKSDTLASEYYDAALNVDQLKADDQKYVLSQQERAEAKLEELQGICGTAISPSRILGTLDEAPGYSWEALYFGSCTTEPPTSIYECYNGRKYVSFHKVIDNNADLLDVKKCIGSITDTDSYVDLVHLGDVNLCVPNVAINNQCGTVQTPCPDTEVGASDGTCSKTGYTAVPKQNGLAFFSTLADGGYGDGGHTCKELRQLRKSRDMLNGKLQSPTFNLVNLEEVAKSLSYEADVGGYVTIRGPNGVLWTTGSAAGGPLSGKFPCSTQDRPAECATDGVGLRCDAVNCVADRGKINERLLNAFLAAKISTYRRGGDPISIALPGYAFYRATPKNSYSTSNIQFWTGTTNVPLKREAGTNWTQFSDDSGYLNNNHWMWYGEGGPWGLYHEDYAGITKARARFGFFKVAVTPDTSTVNGDNIKAFWGGLGGNKDPADGCLVKLLQTGAYNSTDVKALSDCSGTQSVDGNRAIATDDLDCHTGSSECDIFTDGLLFSSRASDVGLQGDGSTAFFDAVTDSENGDVTSFPVSEMPHLYFSNGSKGDAFLDGMEMLCEASNQLTSQVDCSSPPPMRSAEDLGQVGSYLQCLGRRISLKGATAVFRGLPKAVVDPLRNNTGTVYSNAAGEIGAALEDLKSALLGAYKAQQTVGHVVRQFGAEMQALQATLRHYRNDGSIADIQFESTQMRETTNCFAAMSNLASASTYVSPGSVGAAAATCANSFAQIKFADKLRDLQKANTDADMEAAIARFNQSFDEKAQTLDGQSTELSDTLYRINTSIGRVNSLRQRASRILDEATWLMSREAVSSANVRVATENRKAIIASRYTRALDNARKAAFLAKRAIEQRIGQKLETMTEDLPLVEAPARWESSLCSKSYETGLNYLWLSKSSLYAQESRMLNEAESLATTGGYVGEYVSKLENLIESYRLANGFQDGHDTAIVSLRDDVLSVRAPCQVPSNNLLVSSDDLTPKQYGPLGAGKGWFIKGCNENLPDHVQGKAPPNCVDVRIDSSAYRPAGSEANAPLFKVVFGDGSMGNMGPSCCENTPNDQCGWTSSAGLAQTVHVTPGKYVASWIAKTCFNFHPELNGNYLSPTFGGSMSLGSGLHRYWYAMPVEAEGDLTIRFVVCGNPAVMGAPMLEAISEQEYAKGMGLSIRMYEGTDTNGYTKSTVCEDRDGRYFRQRWTTGCQKVCPDGFSTDCKEVAREACYRELAFPMTEWGIESNKQFTQSGFARGNFNYRINRVGLNAVGTGIRDCANSKTPQSCYSGAFANYTLEHLGPFRVRNYQGADVDVALFDGKIEHARVLAAERYITNPISSTDKSLLEDYMRGEMSGRPLSGTFVLRVWDDPNINFDAIEDIQLVLDYGYWTRLSH